MFVSELNYAGIRTHTVVLYVRTAAVTLYGPLFNWQTADALLTALYESCIVSTLYISLHTLLSYYIEDDKKKVTNKSLISETETRR